MSAAAKTTAAASPWQEAMEDVQMAARMAVAIAGMLAGWPEPEIAAGLGRELLTEYLAAHPHLERYMASGWKA